MESLVTIAETVVKAVRSGRNIEGRLMLVKTEDGHNRKSLCQE